MNHIVTISRTEFLSKLRLHKNVDARPVIPILEYAHLRINKDSIEVTTSNIKTVIKTVMTYGIEVFQVAEILIPYAQVVKLLEALPAQPIDIYWSEREEVRYLTCELKIVAKNGGEYIFPSDNPVDFIFPKLKKTDNWFSIEAKVLKSSILSVSYMAEKSPDGHDFYKSVAFTTSDNKLTCASINTGGLHFISENADTYSDQSNVLLPVGDANLLASLIPNGDEIVKVLIEDSRVVFECESISVFLSKIDNQFPDWIKVVPTNYQKLLVVSTEDWISALNRVAIFADQEKEAAELQIKDGEVTIISHNPKIQKSAKEKIKVDMADDMTIGIRISHVKGILSHMDADTVIMKYDLPNKALLFEYDNQTALTMPVHILS